MNKLKIIDVFAGCGGLSIGFKKANFEVCSYLEIDKSCCLTLKENSKKSSTIYEVDITNYESYLQDLIRGLPNNLHGVIGGPPCQAYSIAGRNKEENKMDEDPRNFLFESFNFLLKKISPDFFLFENVTGMLSAKPFGIDVCKAIEKSFNKTGYYVEPNFKNCVFDMSEFGVPQKRKRVIIFGINKSKHKNFKSKVDSFYHELVKRKKKNISTVEDAIGDLPKLFPKNISNKISHTSNEEFSEHVPRYHNERDIKIFKLLAKDIETGSMKYTSSESLKKIYKKFTNRDSSVHKYNVLRWDQPSNTIPAHLYKDGLRHIHPDSNQARSITVREAARIMTFPDDYKLIGSRGDKYKMLGNAVPPKFSRIIAETISKILKN